MKKIVFLILIVSLASSAWAQNKAVEKLFEKYGGKEGFTTIVITKHMFSLFSNVETEADDEYMNMIKNLNNIRILTAPGQHISGVNLHQELMKSLPAKEFEELMVIKEGDKDIKFLVKETGDKISELLMVSTGSEENVLISISGIIDMKAIAKLSKSMNIQGMENLEKVEKED